MNAYAHWHTGTVEIHRTAALVKNYGDHFQYFYSTYGLPPELLDKLVEDAKEYIDDDIVGEYKDLKIEWNTEGNVIYLQAEYNYKAGDDTDDVQDDVRDRLQFLLRASNGLVMELSPKIKKYRKAYLKDLQKRKLDYLSKNDFIYLMMEDLDISDTESDGMDMKEGYFSVLYGKLHIRYMNYGDKMVFAQVVNYPEGSDEQARTDIMALALKIAEKEGRPKGADSLTVVPCPVETACLRVQLEYNFKGAYDGGDFLNYLTDKGRDFMDDIHGEIHKAAGKYVDNLLDKDVDYLTKRIFVMAMKKDGEYARFEKDKEGVTEGYYSFNYTNEYKR